MARIWCVGMLLALTAAAGLGRWSQTAEAILMAGSQAVRLGVTLTGSMMLWGGLMEMLHDTAVLGWVSGGVRRLLKPLVRRELSEESWAAMGMNLTANLFGLGNAATPMGIRAAKLLAEQGENGLRGLTVLLVMNNSGLELMPATVMTLRQQAGSASPGDVWLPTLIATAASAATAALMLWFTDRR